MKRSIIPIFIPHEGCPNDCVFCNQRRIAAEKSPSASDIAAIIKEGLRHAHRPQISFYGGSFTALPRALMESYLDAARPYVLDGSCDSIRLSTRPDAVDGDILDTLLKYGVKTIEIGAQSMSDKVLLASNRGHTAADTVRASELIGERGFELILQMMTGLPQSSYEDELATANAICRLKPSGVRIYPTCVIEDTPLYELYKSGEYEALTVEGAAEACVSLVDIFEQSGIPVVRLGLNPTEELSGGAVKAGAYHPAFGEIVYGKRFLRRLLPMIPKDRPYDVAVPPKTLSVAVGHKKSNVLHLKQISGLGRIYADDIEGPFEIRLK